MSDLNKLQKLALAQGLYSKLGELVSTKTPDSLRAQLDERAEMLYRTDGIKSRDVVINGVKVATYSVRTAKAREAVPASFSQVLSMRESEDVFADAVMADVDVLRGFVMRHARDLASLWLDDFGEIPPGFELVETMDDPGTPAQPERYAGTVLKVDTDKLAMALGPQLPGEVVHILTDGGD